MPLREIENPTPEPSEVVVAVKAVGICGSDVHGYTGSTGRRYPGIAMGHEFSGTISAIGPNVGEYQVGDDVIVDPILTCGACVMCRAGRTNICLNRTMIGMHQHGAYAEAVRVPQRQLHRKPAGLSWERASLGAGVWIIKRGLIHAPTGIVRLGQIEVIGFTAIEYSTVRSPRAYYTVWVGLAKESAPTVRPWRSLLWGRRLVRLNVPPPAVLMP
jgi:D-arabinose 1-dehydrogenase-like Zn-dependent alcohol dehydrogenase